MAHLHNNAGQWAKQRAAQKFIWFITTALVTMTVFGFVGGVFLSRGMTYPSLAIFMAALAGCWLLQTYLLMPTLDKWSRERIKYLRGAQAEALVAWLLRDLGDGWHVFNNLQLDDAGDLDHVIVGPGGVWCISTKSMRGLLTLASDGQLLHNTTPVNWLKAAMGQTGGT